ncbi:hypothetical protein DEO72_LG2g2750 [Vigna unguiculata]|uniref:Uncharacterized protein n=1 Tax=Vigna unguiculata TaxID=3917 RepID=A0A4D6L1P2_VIGUN|nr:hypothetical protein DEO72_LG2g2750 [Vigna unguiculata]
MFPLLPVRTAAESSASVWLSFLIELDELHSIPPRNFVPRVVVLCALGLINMLNGTVFAEYQKLSQVLARAVAQATSSSFKREAISLRRGGVLLSYISATTDRAQLITEEGNLSGPIRTGHNQHTHTGNTVPRVHPPSRGVRCIKPPNLLADDAYHQALSVSAYPDFASIVWRDDPCRQAPRTHNPLCSDAITWRSIARLQTTYQ